jgi:hypothetical protein
VNETFRDGSVSDKVSCISYLDCEVSPVHERKRERFGILVNLELESDGEYVRTRVDTRIRGSLSHQGTS